LEQDGTISYSQTVRVNSVENDDYVINLYPNPVADILKVESNVEFSSIEIYNFNGSRVISTNTKVISMKELATGNYVVKLTDIDGKVSLSKIVKN